MGKSKSKLTKDTKSAIKKNAEKVSKSLSNKSESKSTKRAVPKEFEAERALHRNRKSEAQDNLKAAFQKFDSLHSNDINWWNRAHGVYEQSVKIPFNRILGDNMAIKGYVPGTGQTATDLPQYVTTPGVMSVNFTPTLGRAGKHFDALNLAADRIYSYIYAQYTGAQNFTKADVMFTILTEVSVACLIASAKRGLRALFSYSEVNHNFPRLLYAACGFHPNNFEGEVRDYPALIARLNKIIMGFNSLYTPRFTQVFDRWYSLCSNVWADDNDVASQMFLFRPTGYYVYVEPNTSTETPARLEYRGFRSYNEAHEDSIHDISGLLERAETLLASIRNSSFFNVVNASLGNAFSNNQILKIEPFIQGEIVTPVFDRNMNWQLNNCLAMDWFSDSVWSNSCPSLNLSEDVANNVLKCTLNASSSKVKRFPRVNQLWMNSYDGDISDEFIMESTRLMPVPDVLPGEVVPNASITTFLHSGTEIPRSFQIYWNQGDYTPSGQPTHVAWTLEIVSSWFEESIVLHDPTDPRFGTCISWDGVSTTTSGYSPFSALSIFGLLSKFRNHPLIYTAIWGEWVHAYQTDPDITTTAETNSVAMLPLGDFYKYTLVNKDGLRGLHEAALLSILTADTTELTE